MKINTKNLFVAAFGIVVTLSSAQSTGNCSSTMTKFDSTPQGFDSILIDPGCSSEAMLITSQLAWTIEPTTDTEATIYSSPPNAVTATLKENVLLFNLADMGEVPQKAGIVIQVPEKQLKEVTVGGVASYVRITLGFPYLMSVNSLGVSGVVQADLTDSPYAKLTVGSTTSSHSVSGENLTLAIGGTSNEVYITGSVLRGTFGGTSNELVVNGEVYDLQEDGTSNTLVTNDCSSVEVVNPLLSSCTIMDSEEMPTDIPSVSCTLPGRKLTCPGSDGCSCTSSAASFTSSAASIGLWVVSALSVTLAVIMM
jgi:hypothetical protein